MIALKALQRKTDTGRVRRRMADIAGTDAGPAERLPHREGLV
jgi:hypothetical protein